jgi:formamidopyrimidine-DNA glycosylase
MGSTISDYKTTGGGFGSNQNYLKVYQRQGLPCFECNTTIVKSKVGGRGTHYCPTCQKK